MYWVNFGGWLAGGFLAVAALSMGVQLATIGNTNPMVSLVFSVALMQLAYDLMAWLPGAFTGGLSIRGGDPAGGGGIPAIATGAAVAGVATAGVAAPAVASFAGALPSGESPGLGY